MPRFAVFYVPREDDALYRVGTQLLGYDVRASGPAAMEPDVRAHFAAGEPFDETWVSIARPYGFHLTIGDAIECELGTIPIVERELDDLLRCFDPAHPFRLERRAEPAITVWGAEAARILVLPFTPSDTLLMLHTLVVARLNPLGTGSGYLHSVLTKRQDLALTPPSVQQTRLFFSPTVLGNWYPHFTLLNQYRGARLAEIKQTLEEVFAPFQQRDVHSVCLMIQTTDDEPWRIYREYARG